MLEKFRTNVLKSKLLQAFGDSLMHSLYGVMGMLLLFSKIWHPLVSCCSSSLCR